MTGWRTRLEPSVRVEESRAKEDQRGSDAIRAVSKKEIGEIPVLKAPARDALPFRGGARSPAEILSVRKSVKPEGATSAELLHQALVMKATEKPAGRMWRNSQRLSGLIRLIRRDGR